MNWIQGEKFKELADNDRIFYRHTHLVNDFFKNECPEDPFILVSHNSDGRITGFPRDSNDADVRLMPNNLIHWFGQNVCCMNKKISAIPIGLENSEWFPEIGKIKQMRKMLDKNNVRDKLLYINHNIQTNPIEREKPYKLFHKSPFATVVYGNNGQNFASYLEALFNHRFVICPEGNGTDTHRLWEALYMGCIPIVRYNINYAFFMDLPICFVKEWKEINEPDLKESYELFGRSSFNLDMLNFNYWRKKIVNFKF